MNKLLKECKQKAENRLEFKGYELYVDGLYLEHKNEVLLNSKAQLRLLKSGNPSVRRYQKIINTINLDINNDTNWDQFRNYFEDLHKDFNSKAE